MDMLTAVENNNRKNIYEDYVPWARGTKFSELVEVVCPDKNGTWATPLLFIISRHNAIHGIKKLERSVNEFFEREKAKHPLDVLSISANMDNNKIILKSLIRPYTKEFNFINFFKVTGDPVVEDEIQIDEPTSGNLIVPDEILNFSYSENDKLLHKNLLSEQQKFYDAATIETPFLNAIAHYIPKKMPLPEDNVPLIYDLKTLDQKVKTITPYEKFTEIFREIMTHVNGTEYYSYKNVIEGNNTEESFMNGLDIYIEDHYIKPNIMHIEDKKIMLEKLYRSLFKLYVVQDLIDDPKVTDIKITGPYSIRARVNGKAYISNITFIDEADYRRFINAICIRNRVKQNIPEQTFTDKRDERYILRFSLTAEYVNSVDWPYLHIRKIDRDKPLDERLFKAGMFNEKVRDFLLDCARNSRGVVFAGPPGSGKTVLLNWFLERGYEQSAEILVIQENDELFTYRQGVMFQHVVNYAGENEQPVTLEELGQLALVAGANVFIIGEAKGAEICSAITLSNSGCRTAMTIHSPSSTETIDKMADLAMRGYAKDITQAKKMLRSFQHIVYLENFHVKEISEITGFNDATGDMEYKYIYRCEEEEN